MSMEKPEDGKRYNRSYHGYRAEIFVDQGIKVAPIQLPPPELFVFPGASFLQLSDVSFRYATSTPWILQSISLDVGPQARVGLLGPNECGKSTLMNLLVGELKPLSGEIKKYHRLRIGYFSWLWHWRHCSRRTMFNLLSLKVNCFSRKGEETTYEIWQETECY